MDAQLVFECLMYLNLFYYFMFALANFGIWIAKQSVDNKIYNTPNINRDAYVALTLTVSELLKLVLYRKFRRTHLGWATLLGILFSVLSVFCLLYVFIFQEPVLKLEHCMDSMLFVLLIGEIIYGIYSFLPCCTVKDWEK
ncbi:hypothetical protein ILUMI_20896 [Ignelater luminosus]|uniref:Uncharacterized protein n=1 Tax=Ignelater luminosus TaxID=2038154 RepID=A0A8K0CIU1_IGNLU|nr:hypothetical protein ILUMI_20896 [Ignelater luminosus]